ncbi:enoyl-CoA hydratase [Mycolicibacterium chitae]|uniref:Enoyl-CoA hydratase n=1 Tax=Mycolicibacterium chitae TaxID=1792 RepID=A0A3S4V8V7_MYCCI|nr:enoyl-CoA hydratase [Mycolicibacterium chitae]MCV7106607.1 enoyl-CoA hydratase [Mycolicibacterium chitae]VEG46415.1 enoyl-CoA hydratase [Mycolicibacterium chitae]
MTITDSGLDALAPVDGLLVDLTDGVLAITIDRPDSLNSVNPQVFAAMADTLERAATDPRVRVVRIGGTGRGFCSGAAIGAEDTGDGHEPMETLHEGNRAIRAIVNMPRPVVAVVQGPTAGIGVSVALACDLVLASEKAFFLLAFTKIGLMPDGGASALVAAAIGRIRAMKMALLAERVSAADALDWGMVSAVYPADTLEAESTKLIQRLMSGPAVAYAKTKKAINGATLDTLDTTLAHETAGQHKLLQAPDLAEGIQAFQEKRSPNFTDV